MAIRRDHTARAVQHSDYEGAPLILISTESFQTRDIRVTRISESVYLTPTPSRRDSKDVLAYQVRLTGPVQTSKGNDHKTLRGEVIITSLRPDAPPIPASGLPAVQQARHALLLRQRRGLRHLPRGHLHRPGPPRPGPLTSPSPPHPPEQREPDMTTTDTTTIVPLTNADVVALRKADQVVFRSRKGVSTIEAGLNTREPDIFTATEQRLFPSPGLGSSARERVLTIRGSISWYEGDTYRIGREHAAGFAMIHAAQYTSTWQTIVSLLRAGDVLGVHFKGDQGSNGYTKEAGLHADTLRLVVVRDKGDLVFNVDTRVTPSNTARMVQTYSN
jgi:hypothetical protein